VVGQYTFQLIVNDGGRTARRPADRDRHGSARRITIPRSHRAILRGHGPRALLRTNVQATDPDGDPITFRLLQKPAGMTVNTNTGPSPGRPRTRWSPTCRSSRTTPRASCSQGYSLTVLPYESLPRSYFGADHDGAPGTQYVYTAVAVDPNGDSVTYALTQKPSAWPSTPGTARSPGRRPRARWAATRCPLRRATAMRHRDASLQSRVLTAGADGPLVQPLPDQDRSRSGRVRDDSVWTTMCSIPITPTANHVGRNRHELN